MFVLVRSFRPAINVVFFRIAQFHPFRRLTADDIRKVLHLLLENVRHDNHHHRNYHRYACRVSKFGRGVASLIVIVVVVIVVFGELSVCFVFVTIFLGVVVNCAEILGLPIECSFFCRNFCTFFVGL